MRGGIGAVAVQRCAGSLRVLFIAADGNDEQTGNCGKVRGDTANPHDEAANLLVSQRIDVPERRLRDVRSYQGMRANVSMAANGNVSESANTTTTSLARYGTLP